MDLSFDYNFEFEKEREEKDETYQNLNLDGLLDEEESLNQKESFDGSEDKTLNTQNNYSIPQKSQKESFRMKMTREIKRNSAVDPIWDHSHYCRKNREKVKYSNLEEEYSNQLYYSNLSSMSFFNPNKPIHSIPDHPRSPPNIDETNYSIPDLMEYDKYSNPMEDATIQMHHEANYRNPYRRYRPCGSFRRMETLNALKSIKNYCNLDTQQIEYSNPSDLPIYIMHIPQHKSNYSNPPPTDTPKAKVVHCGRQVKPKGFTNIKQWSRKAMKSMLPVEFQLNRPPFTYVELTKLALKNTPNQSAPLNEIRNFILHHFPYFRYRQSQWMDNLRNMLNKNPEFTKNQNGLYSTIEPIGDIEFSKIQRYHIWKEDSRGGDFFIRMSKGDVGIPRGLFYHIVCHFFPRFAGAENSALFYYLLSIGHVPKVENALEYFQLYTEGTRFEPKFDQKDHVDSDKLMRVNSEENSEWNQIDSNIFHSNIQSFFKLQEQEKLRNAPNWMTPKLIIN